MRMWMVPPEGMCQNHLLGEHRELHMIPGSVNLDMRNQLEGLARDGCIDLSLANERHEELVEEMERRDWTGHDTPLDYDESWTFGEVDVESNKKELNSRECDCSFEVEQ